MAASTFLQECFTYLALLVSTNDTLDILIESGRPRWIQWPDPMLPSRSNHAVFMRTWLINVCAGNCQPPELVRGVFTGLEPFLSEFGIPTSWQQIANVRDPETITAKISPDYWCPAHDQDKFLVTLSNIRQHFVLVCLSYPAQPSLLSLTARIGDYRDLKSAVSKAQTGFIYLSKDLTNLQLIILRYITVGDVTLADVRGFDHSRREVLLLLQMFHISKPRTIPTARSHEDSVQLLMQFGMSYLEVSEAQQHRIDRMIIEAWVSISARYYPVLT